MVIIGQKGFDTHLVDILINIVMEFHYVFEGGKKLLLHRSNDGFIIFNTNFHRKTNIRKSFKFEKLSVKEHNLSTDYIQSKQPTDLTFTGTLDLLKYILGEEIVTT